MDTVVTWAPWPGGAPGEIIALLDKPPRTPDGERQAVLTLAAPGPRQRLLFGREVLAIEDARFADVTHRGKPVLIMVWKILGPGEQLVVLDSTGARPEVLLAVPACAVSLEDVDGDGSQELIATTRRPQGVARARIVYRWAGVRFERATTGLDRFYASEEASIRERLTASRGLKEGDQGFADRLVDWLDLGYMQETLGLRHEAWVTYSRLLEEARVPVRLTREEFARRAAIVQLTNETRRAMAKVAGLRLIGEPRPSPATAPTPAPAAGSPAPSSAARSPALPPTPTPWPSPSPALAGGATPTGATR